MGIENADRRDACPTGLGLSSEKERRAILDT